jgi:hypothetical protein
MLDCSAGCIGRWNHSARTATRVKTTFPSNASFLGKRFQTGDPNGNCIGPPVTLFGCPPIFPVAGNHGSSSLSFPHSPHQALCTNRLSFNRLVSREIEGPAWLLCKRRLSRRAILQHNGNAILNRVVAATTTAMQPCLRGFFGTDGKRVMAYRANQDFEQSLGKHRLRTSLDESWTSGLELINELVRPLSHLP